MRDSLDYTNITRTVFRKLKVEINEFAKGTDLQTVNTAGIWLLNT